MLLKAWPLFVGETTDDCSADATNDGPDRSSDNRTAYCTCGCASRRSSGLGPGGKRKCKESQGGKGRDLACCHGSTFRD